MKPLVILFSVMLLLLNGCAAVRLGGRVSQGAGDAMVQSADEEEAKQLQKKNGPQSNSVNSSKNDEPQQGGKTDPQLLKAQKVLADAGYDPGAVNGKMGKKTKEAIRLFQKDNNLAITGELNKATLSRLDIREKTVEPTGVTEQRKTKKQASYDDKKPVENKNPSSSTTPPEKAW